MIEELIKQNKQLFLTFNYILLVKIALFITVSIPNIITDIKSKSVSSMLFIILTVLSLLYQLIFSKDTFFHSLIGVILIVTTFLIILLVSKGGLGLGDMFYLGFFASMFGFIISLVAFLLSFWIATLILIIPYLTKKIGSKTKIPLLPFIFAGCICGIVILYFI